MLALTTYALSFVPGVRGRGPAFVPLLDIGLGDGISVLAGILCLTRTWRVPQARAA